MSQHVTLSPTEAADRLAIRELVETYAHCADRRDTKGQTALFTADTHFVVYMNAKDPPPSQELHSREALAPVFRFYLIGVFNNFQSRFARMSLLGMYRRMDSIRTIK